jgi:Tesmin/TSO1-like CXC domain, cysteine-rich domain
MSRDNISQQPRKAITAQAYHTGHINQPAPIPQPLHVFYPYGCYPSPQTHALMNHGSSPPRIPSDKSVYQQSSYSTSVSIASGAKSSQSVTNNAKVSSPQRISKPGGKSDNSTKRPGNSPKDNNMPNDGHPVWCRHMQSPYTYPHPSSYTTEWSAVPPHHPLGPTIQYHHWNTLPPPGNGRYSTVQTAAIQHSHLPRDGRPPFWFNPAVCQQSLGSRSLQTVNALHSGASQSNEKATPSERFRQPITSFGTSTMRPSSHKEDVCPTDLAIEDRATSPSQIEVNHRDEVENMGCTCKKTNCLKLYCQCFAIKIFCGENCRCKHCFNNVEHDKDRKEAMRSILNRNPAAFETKFKKSAEAVPVETAAIVEYEKDKILSHKIGCKCRKSNCMKKVSLVYLSAVHSSK